MALFNSAFTGGFSSYLCSNTLRNSPKHWSFPKADRFLPITIDNTAKFTSYPTLVSTRYSTLGHGDRLFLKELPGSSSPPPTQYRIASTFEKQHQIKGKTFGVSRKYYDNVYVPGSEIVAPCNAVQVPGPGQYSHAESNPLGKSAKKMSLKSRIPESTSASKDFPAPNMYRPGYALVEQNRFNGVGFGVGNRGSPTGPGSIIS